MFIKRTELIFLVIFVILVSGSMVLEAQSKKQKIIPTSEDQEFVNKIRSDLGFNEEVILSVGPYYGLEKLNLSNGRIFSVGQDYLKTPSYLFFDDVGLVYYILIDYNFYKKINEAERRFVIAHEMGHSQNPALRQSIVAEKAADLLALAYVGPDVAIDFLNKYYVSQSERDQRIENIKTQAAK